MNKKILVGGYMKELSILKRYVYETQDLSIPVDYFFDLMEKNQSLRGEGHLNLQQIDNNADLCAAISATLKIAGDLLRKSLDISSIMFNFVTTEQFYHGACTFLGHPIPMLVLYFADIQTGISVVGNREGDTNYFRFTLANEKDFMKKH